MGPLTSSGLISPEGNLVVAFLLGILFGFFLERAGFGSARKLAAVFYGRDMAVLKVMFTAIVVAMVGLQYLGLFGRLDLSQVYVLPTYLWPQIAGGLIFGVGFVVGGYCPGTAVVAAGSGKKDALAFMAGILVGIALWGVSFPALQAFYVSGSLGSVTLPQWLGLSPGLVALLVVLMALGAFKLATVVEMRLRAADAGHAAAEVE